VIKATQEVWARRPMPALGSSEPAPAPNPYVGPRPFRVGESLYGRERETDELLDLLLAERIVLLHSPSGAGKSSLIHAALIPRLKREGFTVLPTMRVSRPAPESRAESNRYVRSAQLDLDPANDQAEALPSTLRLAERLVMVAGGSISQAGTATATAAAAEEGLQPQVLIVDQFEELLTIDPNDFSAKEEFCRQLGAVLQDRNRWAVIAMRDEYIGALAPFLHLLPTRLGIRYRLELLRPEAAREAIRGPAKPAGLEYDDKALDRLIEDLRQGGPFIEPVHLQVVCTNLWLKLPPGTSRIRESDIAGVGDVDTALAGYYATAVATAAKEGNSPERAIRKFINDSLIVNQVRAQSQAAAVSGITQESLRVLEDTYVIRREDRRGTIWYELAHDRLIGPILRDNARWKEETDPYITKLAEEWDRRGRPNRLLLLMRPQSFVTAFQDMRRRRKLGIPLGESPKVVADFMRASTRFQVILTLAILAVIGLIAFVAYTVSQTRENKRLEQALEAEQTLSAKLKIAMDSISKATDSARLVSHVLYQKAWGLEDTSVGKVRASVAANRALQQAVKASPATARKGITINYYTKRSDAQRVEFALKELGYAVDTKPAYHEDLATNTVSFGSAVPPEDVQIIALAVARTGATLRRVCPFVAARGRDYTVEIIGSAASGRAPPLSLAQLEALKTMIADPGRRGLQCRGAPVSSR
jgi:hypothetical protein